MSNQNNGRSPTEIKDGLVRCKDGRRCKQGDDHCPYHSECFLGYPAKQMIADTLVYIQSLEENLDRAIKAMITMNKENDELKALLPKQIDAKKTARCKDYRGRCATCIHFQRNENPEIRDGKCLNKRRSRGGVIGYSAGCKDWTLKLSTVCKRCSTFIEHWYNYCPVCGMLLPEPPEEDA